MGKATDLPLPSSRALASWQRNLRRLRPTRQWLYHFILHRIEAQVHVADSAPLRDLDQLILEATGDLLREHATPDELYPALVERLHLDREFLERLLESYQSQGLLTSTNGAISLTESGRTCLEKGHYPAWFQQRRSFYFAESAEGEPPIFLPLRRPQTTPWEDSEAKPFDPQVLTDCMNQDAQWKESHGFPVEVQSLCQLQALDAGSTAHEQWQRIIVDHPEHCLLLLVENSNQELHGYTIQNPGWKLRLENPVLQLGPGGAAYLPALQEVPEVEVWQAAWEGWGTSHQLPRKDLRECEIQVKTGALEITPTPELYLMLQNARSEPLRNDVWLRAGSGRARHLLPVKIHKPADSE